MARGYHRLSYRARHILRQFGKAKNITLQRLHLHELRHAISRKHGFRGPKGKPKLGQPGLYQRLSRKGRKLATRLRHSRSWQVQKQTVNELEREVQRGERIAVARAKRQQRRAGRLRDRSRQFRGWAQAKQEPGIARAERKQSERETGKRKPPLPARARQHARARTAQVRGRVKSWRPRRRARPQRAPQPARARTPQTPRPLRPAARTRPTRAARPRVARTR